MGGFIRMFKGISFLGNVIACVLLGSVAFLMGGEIIGRRIFNSPIPGTFEIVAAAMAILTTIGFAFALEQGTHIRATVMVDRLAPSGRRNMLLYNYIVGFLVIGLLLWRLVISAGDSFAIREYTDGIVAVPIYIPRMIMAFSVFLFWLGFFNRILVTIKNRTQ